MAFQIKDFTSIVASSINWMKSTQNRITDFNIGSVVRTIIEAVASEIDELYQQMFHGLKEAIPAATYYSFDFDALPALPATGMLRVTITSNSQPVMIAAGTTVTYLNGNVDYTVNQDTTIPAGSTFVDLRVTATRPGVEGNVPAGLQFELSPAPEGFVEAVNLSPWSNGADKESEDDRKVRFKAYVQSLNRGTVAALKYGLKTTALTDSAGNVTERVVSASVVEPWKDIDPNQPISLVQCYVHNGVGSTSGNLVNRARDVIYGYYDANGNAIPGWKAAGVKVDVFAAVEQTVAIAGVLTPLPGYDKPTLVAQAREAVYAYILGLEIGAPAIRSEIIAIIMGVEGVYNFVPSAPTADVSVDKKTKLMPAAITIT